MINEQTLQLALVGASAGLLYTAKGWLTSVYNTVYSKIIGKFVFSATVNAIDWELYNAVNWYLSSHYVHKFNEATAMVINDNVSIRQNSGYFQFNYNNRKIIVTCKKEELKGNSSSLPFNYMYTFSGFNGRSTILGLLEYILSKYRAYCQKDGVVVCTSTRHGEFYQFGTVPAKSFDQIILDESLKSSIIDDIDQFQNHHDWYVTNSIRYKRGICLYGPPGTGKTSISMALAAKYGRKVYCLNIKALQGDDALVSAFSNLSDNSILLLEDFDTIFEKRKGIDHEISFSALLNCLDGAFYKSGVIVIVTANNIDNIDSALMRPGRIDSVFLIPNPSHSQIKQYVESFYKINTNEDFSGVDMPMSFIQEQCIQNKDNSIQAIKQIQTKNQ